MPAPAASNTVTVHSNVADQGWGKDPDVAAVTTKYFGAPAFGCRAGDDVSITVRGQDPQGPPRISNGVTFFDIAGRRLSNATGATVAGPAQPADKNFLAPGLPAHALVARFGSQPPFLLGESWSGVATDKNLYVAVNDTRGQFFNNAGDYTVTAQTPVAFPIRSEYAFSPGRNLAAGGGYYLVFQSDGNLVVYSGDPVWQNAVWALNTVPGIGDKWKTVARMTFTGNGALLAETAGARPVWTSDSQDIPHRGCQLELDEKGTLRIVRRPPSGPSTEYWKA